MQRTFDISTETRGPSYASLLAFVDLIRDDSSNDGFSWTIERSEVSARTLSRKAFSVTSYSYRKIARPLFSQRCRSHVLLLITNRQVFLSIVVPQAVQMVNDARIGFSKTHDKTVHTSQVVVMSIEPAVDMPGMLIQSLRILGVHQGESAFRKDYKRHGTFDVNWVLPTFSTPRRWVNLFDLASFSSLNCRHKTIYHTVKCRMNLTLQRLQIALHDYGVCLQS